MKDILKKIGRGIMQGFLSMLAFTIVLLALTQIALMVGFAAFNTGKGRTFIEEQLQNALADSGYNIAIGTLFYDPVRGMSVYDVTLSDQEGTFATLDRLSVGIVFEKLFVRDLEIFANGGTLALSRFPQGKEKEEAAEEKTALQPFSLPDIYVHRVGIDYFTMKEIVLPSDDAEQIKSISPTLRAELLLGEAANLDTKLTLRPSLALKTMQVPDGLALKGSFAPSSLKLALDNLQVMAEKYSIEGSGSGNFSQDGDLDFKIVAKHSDLSSLSADNFERADINAAVTGPMSAPVLKLDGTIVPALLAERGLDDILLKVTGTDLASEPKIDANIVTKYDGQDIAIDTNIIYATPTITIQSIEGTAPFAKISGAGTYNLESALADIKLGVALEKLAHYSALAGIDLSGSLKADIIAAPQNDKQSLNVDAVLDNGQYGTIKVRKVDADLSFPDILNAYWPQKADVKIASLSLSNDLSIIAAAISLKQAEGETYALSLNGNGSMGSPFTFKGGALIESFSTPLPSVKNIDLSLGLGRSSISLKGNLDPQTVNLSVNTNNLRAGDLPLNLSGQMSRIAINGKIDMTGAPASPVTAAAIGITGLNTGKYEGLSINLDATHREGKAQAQVSGKGTGIRTLNAEASLPLAFSLSPFSFAFDNNATINGKLAADIDLAPIASLFLQPMQIVTGTLNATGTIGGSVSSPSINGNASIDKASFLDEQNGIELDGIIVKSRFTQDAINITTLQATDGESGTLNGSGNISFRETGTDLSLAMTNFHLPKSNMANGFLNAKLALRDSGSAYEATGDIYIQSMDLLIPETFQSKIPELNIVKRGEEKKEGAGKALLLNIDVNADNQFFVRGWGLDAEFGGAIAIAGSADEPLFDGTFKSRRGRYEEFGKRFELARANLRFQGTIPPSPYLDIEATTNAEEVVASVLLSGPVQNPKIAFSSVPSLPEDEVLARILFGKSTTRISAFQAIQLTQTIQRFSGQGGGGLDPLGMLRGMTGLDDISVETDSEGQTSVGVGKYLTDSVYLEFERGAGGTGGGTNLQIEVSPSITIESEIGQDAQGGGGVFWKRDY